jgi:solute carrier family 45 protein 1/2/4
MVALNLLTLGWAAEIIGLFFTNQSFIERGTVTLAIFCIYAVDFAINAVQATCRSLIVDTLPTSEQQAGSAWAGRMLGFGHVLGYFAGTLDMSKIFGTLIGDTQFKQVCVLASVVIVFCVGTTCFCVEERVLLSQRDDGTHSGSGAWKMLTTILKTTLHLPRKIRAVCWITFWCWIGWSPFFVYGTTWVGETYYREDESRASELRGAVDPVGLLARKGSGALFLFSLISLAGSIMLPWFVESPEGDDHSSDPKKDSEGFLSTLRRYRIDITTAWGLSQVLFGFAMLLAPISHSFQFATTLIALCGLYVYPLILLISC